MKNLIITLLSVLALSIAFTGCGDSAGSISSVSGDNAESTSPLVTEEESDTTTPNTPYNLSNSVGTPPGLPG